MFDFNAVLSAAIRTAVEEVVAAKMESAVADMIEREIKNQLEIHEMIRPDSPTEAQVVDMIDDALNRYDFESDVREVVRDILRDASLSIDL